MSVLMDALKKVEETKKTELESATNEEISESSNLVDSNEDLQIFEITDNVELKPTLPQLDQISESDIEDFNQELQENFKETNLPETLINDNDNLSLKKQSIDESISQFQNDETHSSSHNWDDDFLPEFQPTVEQLDSVVPETDKATEESTDWNKELVLDDFEENEIQSEQTAAENSQPRSESVNHDTKKTAQTFWNQAFVDDFKEDEIELGEKERKNPESAPLEKGGSIFSNEQTSTSAFESVNNNDTEKNSSAFPFEQHEPWQSQKNARVKDHSTEVKKEVPLSKTETKGDSFSETIIHQPPQPEDAKRILAANGSPPTSSKKSTFILFGVMSIVAIGVGSLFFMPSLLTESPSTLKFGQLNRRTQQPAMDHDKPTLLSESSTSSTLSIAPIPSPPPSEEKTQMVAKARQASNESTNQVSTQISEKSTEESSNSSVQNQPKTDVSKPSIEPKQETSESSVNSNNSNSKPSDKAKEPDESSKTDKSPSTSESVVENLKNFQDKEPSSITIGEPKISSLADTPGIYVRKNVINQISQEILTGYNAFQRGDDKTAYQAYQRALQQDDKNRDALLGLGALAMREGKMRLAQYYYQRVLKLYPQDSYAIVGLTNTLDKRLPESESQLKLLLEQTPQSAYIHFSLGTFYANQGQWAKAQQAYFDAYRYDKTQADYAYNLAVSLEHLNQPGTALTYYQKALQLARHQMVNFSPSAVQNRVQTLLTHTRASALTNLSTE